MASKRQRGDGSESASAPQKFDSCRFVSAAAQEHSLVPECGLRPDQSKDGDMAVMIAERNWFTLTEQPDPTVIAIIKEFYANVSEHYHYGVYVRGKTVEFGEGDINGCYQLHLEDQNNEVWTGGANHPRGLGFIIPQAAAQPNPPATAPLSYGSSSAAHRGVVPKAVQREIDGWFYNLESQNVLLSERQDVIYKYLVDQFSTQNAMNAQLYPGVNLSQFPTAPVLPVFPPSDQEMNEDDDAPPEE